jgi:iduronate 2-sulfatase
MFGKWTNYENSLRSPLIIRVPGLRQPGVSTRALVSTIDIYPTLAGLCGMKAPASVQGRSLSAALDEPTVTVREIVLGTNGQADSLRTDRWRFIEWRKPYEGKKVVELYDHQTDPAETANIAASHPEEVKELSAKLREERAR